MNTSFFNKAIKIPIQAIWENKLCTAAACLCDLLFLTTITWGFVGFVNATAERFVAITAIVNQATAQTTSEITRPEQLLGAFPQLDVFQQHVAVIMESLLWYFILFFVAWCIFEGSAWILAHHIIEKKPQRMNLWSKVPLLLLHFSLVSIVLFAVILAVSYLVMRVKVYTTMSVFTLVPESAVRFGGYLIILIAFFYCLTLYGQIDRTKQFWKVQLSAKKLITPAILLLLSTAVVYFLSKLIIYAGGYNLIIAFLILFFVLLPLLTLFRIMWITTLQHSAA